MEHTQQMLPAILLFFLLLTASGMGPRVVEARICASQSQKFKGRCAHSTNCANVCLTEGFTSGECRGHLRLFRQCFCTKYC